MGNNFQRLFYIFKSMDNDLGNPTGYIKAEINGEKARLQLSLSNLPIRHGVKYRLYGINRLNNRLAYTLISEIPNMNGRADLKLDTDILDIGDKHMSFEDINILAVIAKLPDGYSSVVCPLVAYRNGEVSWKREFESALKAPRQQEAAVDTGEGTEGGTADYDETHMVNLDKKPEERRIITNEELEAEELIEETAGDLSDLIEVQVDRASDGTEDGAVNNSDSPSDAGVSREEGQKSINDMSSVEVNESNTGVKGFDGRKSSSADIRAGLRKTGENFMERLKAEDQQLKGLKGNQDSDVKSHLESEGKGAGEAETGLQVEGRRVTGSDEITSKLESTLTSLYNQEMESIGLHSENDIIGSAERNFMELSSINTDGDRVNNELDIDLLKEELDKSFEPCNPFSTRSKRFKWWKINSPGYLNNILFRNNVKTYLLFNPKVMLAHYKYRYIIFGIRFDKFSGRERLVCGVPGVYSIDENPFGSIGSWVQLEGYKPKYGAFGYWIILIDPRTGKLIKIK